MTVTTPEWVTTLPPPSDVTRGDMETVNRAEKQLR